MDTKKNIEKSFPLQIVSLTAAVVGCILCSLPGLGSRSFWVDEVYTYNLIQKSWPDMLLGTMRDVHPPLYYIILRLFVTAFGTSDFCYRFASFIPFLLIAAVSVFSVRKKLGYLPALLFILLSGLMPSAIVYNAEARMYSWALLFVSLCGYSLFLIEEEGTKRSWILFALMGLGAAYTHYYAFLSICFLYLMLLISQLVHKKGIRSWLICFAVSVLGYLPWLIPFITTLGRTAGDFWLTVIPTLRETLRMVYSDHIAGWLLMFITIAASAGYLLFSRSRLSARYWLVLSTAVSCAGTLAIAYAASFLIRPLYLTRYFYPCCGLIWLSLGVCVQELTKNRKILRYLVPVLLLVLVLDCFYKPFSARREEIREVNETVDFSLNYVRERAVPGDVLCSNVGYELSPEGLAMYFRFDPQLSVAHFGSDWLREGQNTFLFTRELGYLPEEIENEIKASGYTVSESHGVCLEAGYYTVYYITPAA